MATTGQPSDSGQPTQSGPIFVRCRGLPWSATPDEVVKFFHDCKIVGGAQGIKFTVSADGRPSGECFAELSSEEDLKNALAHSNEHMGRRYVEVFESKRSEMDWVFRHSSPKVGQKGEAIVRLRGLPFGCSKEEIAHFFSGLEIVPNGITQVIDQYGRIGGEAYVEFTSPDVAQKALAKHKETLGHRYIEVFSSTRAEMLRFTGQPMHSGPPPLMGQSYRSGPYDRPGYDRDGAGRGGRYSSGYERQYRGGGRGGGRGGWRGGYYGSGGSAPPAAGGDFYGADPYAAPTPDRPFPPNTTVLNLRGLPFSASEQDVKQFFLPLMPTYVNILYDDSGRPSGMAEVTFACPEDAQTGMRKDRQMMGSRYIELFPRPPDVVQQPQQQPQQQQQPPPAQVPNAAPGQYVSGAGSYSSGGAYQQPAPAAGGYAAPPPQAQQANFAAPVPAGQGYYSDNSQAAYGGSTTGGPPQAMASAGRGAVQGAGRGAVVPGAQYASQTQMGRPAAQPAYPQQPPAQPGQGMGMGVNAAVSYY